MASFVNAVVFTAASGGTGTFTVASAVTGWLTPAQAGAVNAASYRYRAYSSNLSEWEVGTGTYTSSGTTLTRTPLYSSNANAAVNFTAAPSVALTVFAADLTTFTDPITPATDNAAALGVSGTAWSDLFLASGGVIDFNAGNWVATHTSDILTVGTGDLRVTTAGTNTASVATVGGTQTLTNKRVTPRVTSETSSATPTINTDNCEIHRITALAVDITSMTTNLSGTPTHGQPLTVEITGTATRTISWGASFEGSTTLLPTATDGTNMLAVGFKWNLATSKWRCLAVV